MSEKDKLEKFMNFINEDVEWESLPTEEKLGRNVIYFMKKWGEAVKDNAIYRQENAQLESENKSLRESIADLQTSLGETLDALKMVMNDKRVPLDSLSVASVFHNTNEQALERLKARGHWVEEV